ncbi:hypothetical protein CYV19_11795 [Natronobacterium gregoryi SP2]|uniref:Uncharacterized protein n=1 Tax=Natronobacterium gregoryi (strain ATCC 43098 / DSM 3393 / CCM 3738 / CIP 104747 / IAM 13177 / JCM 8860 / NBRC 102187 / NCIMB 2189 / SP2) TaxID=797304 RepID=A0A2J4JDM7_NATGS|nr:hypothetical protein CYV19_11795 [Natronobacterium gregoryi SP2]
MAQTDHDSRSEVECTSQSRLGTVLVPSQPSTDGPNRATPPDSAHQFRLGPPLVFDRNRTAFSVGTSDCGDADIDDSASRQFFVGEPRADARDATTAGGAYAICARPQNARVLMCKRDALRFVNAVSGGTLSLLPRRSRISSCLLRSLDPP